MISFESVQKHYKDKKTIVEVFSDISFSINKNGLYALKGISGSGKTTLINIITNNITIDKGQVTIASEDITVFDQEQWRKFNKENIAYMPQKNFFASYLTVGENIKSLLSAKEVFFDEDFFCSMLKHFNVPNKKVSKLSAGEKQRALFVFTIMNNRKIMIFDEPTSSSDSYNAELIYEYLKSIAYDKIIIISSNKEKEIAVYVDFFIEIENKKVSLRANDIKSREMRLTDKEKQISNEPSKQNHFLNQTKVFRYHYILNIFLILLTAIFSLFISVYFLKGDFQNTDENILYLDTNDSKIIDSLLDANLIVDYSDYYSDFKEAFVERKNSYSDFLFYDVYKFTYKHDVLYIEGKMPDLYNEVVLPDKSGYNVGDKAIISTGFHAWEMNVSGLTKTNNIYFTEMFFDYIAFENYVAENAPYFPGVRLTAQPIKKTFDLDNNEISIIAHVKQENIIDDDNLDISFGNLKIKDGLVINIISDEDEEHFEFSAGLIEYLCNVSSDNNFSLLIESYNKYEQIEQMTNNNDVLIYPYLTNPSMQENTINPRNVQDILFLAFFILFNLIIGCLISQSIYRKTPFRTYYYNQYDQKSKQKLFILESSLLTFIVYILTILLFAILINNVSLFTGIFYSNLLVYYYLMPLIIFIIVNLLQVKRGVNYD